MSILISRGLFFGQDIILVCDLKCHKAWGINERPRIYLDDETLTVYPTETQHSPDIEGIDYDNYAMLADKELGRAPRHSPISEGGECKPMYPQRHNKWCARECERCTMLGLKDDIAQGDSQTIKDFKTRFYNKTQKEGGE